MDVIRLIWLKIHRLKIHLVENSQHWDAEKEKAWLSPQRASEEGSCPQPPGVCPGSCLWLGTLPSPQLRLLSSFWVTHALQPMGRWHAWDRSFCCSTGRNHPAWCPHHGAPWSVLSSNEETSPQSRLQYFFILHHLWASELSRGRAGLGFRHEKTTPSVQTGGAFEDFIPIFFFSFSYALCLRQHIEAKPESSAWVYCILQGVQYPIQVAMSLQIKGT